MITEEQKTELDTLIGEIQAAHTESENLTDQAVGMAGLAIKARINLGAKLTRAKGIVGHGNWSTWLEANFPKITERSAQRFMRLSKTTILADLNNVGSLTEAYILCGLLPEREGQDNQQAEKGSNYLVHLTRLERVLTVADAVKWEVADREQLRQRLKPLVELYERLTPEGSVFKAAA